MSNPLLEEAIKRHSIPPWPYQAAFDRVIVFSLPEEKALRKTFAPEGRIIKPDSHNEYEKQSTPRGVIVSAGLQAVDILRSHGMGLGHIVWVARLSPWRHEVDRDKEGQPVEFLFLRAGDIVGSETLLASIAAGSVWAHNDNGTTVYRQSSTDTFAEPRFDPPSYAA